jgi:hypothetical protein
VWRIARQRSGESHTYHGKAVSGRTASRQKKKFFFEKKNQKTFVSLAHC